MQKSIIPMTRPAAAVQITLAPLQESHYGEVKRIYAAGIASGRATLEVEAPEWPAWDREHLRIARFVALSGKQVVGWVALTPVSGRCVYRGVAEVSVYLDPDFQGRGVGKLLLQALIRESESHGFWTLQAGIFKENAASVRLHVNGGFRIVGLREKIGQLAGAWKDIYLLERRSQVVGIS